MNSRLFAIIRKEFIQIFRDKRTLIMILIIPIVQLFVMGYSANSDVRNVSLVVYDQSYSTQSRELLDAFRAADYFSINGAVGSEAELRSWIDKGQAKAGLIIPPDYSQRVASGNAQVSFILDGSDPTIAATSLSAAQFIGQSYSTKVLTEKFNRAGIGGQFQQPVEIRSTVWYNPDMISAYFMVPGVIGMILFAITAILTATAVVRERERGTIEQLIVTPIRSWELVVGKILPYTILAMFDTLEVLLIGHYWFDVPIRSPMILIMAVSALFLLSGLGIGLFASTMANTQQEAMLSVWMILLPSLFISGFFFPLDAMPDFLKIISYAIPLRYYLIIIRVLLLKGVGLEMIVNDVIALAVFGVVIMTAAAMRFKKRLD